VLPSGAKRPKPATDAYAFSIVELHTVLILHQSTGLLRHGPTERAGNGTEGPLSRLVALARLQVEAHTTSVGFGTAKRQSMTRIHVAVYPLVQGDKIWAERERIGALLGGIMPWQGTNDEALIHPAGILDAVDQVVIDHSAAIGVLTCDPQKVTFLAAVGQLIESWLLSPCSEAFLSAADSVWIDAIGAFRLEGRPMNGDDASWKVIAVVLVYPHTSRSSKESSPSVSISRASSQVDHCELSGARKGLSEIHTYSSLPLFCNYIEKSTVMSVCDLIPTNGYTIARRTYKDATGIAWEATVATPITSPSPLLAIMPSSGNIGNADGVVTSVEVGPDSLLR
jgi:hypothetical protein